MISSDRKPTIESGTGVDNIACTNYSIVSSGDSIHISIIVKYTVPRTRIDKIEEYWFWDYRDAPWDSPRHFQREENRLREYGITALPKLADTLADVVFNEAVKSVRNAVEIMARREDSEVVNTLSGWIRLPQSATES